MLMLVAGLIVFLGAHSVRIVADDWRARQIARMGEGPWKGLHSIVSLIGLALIVWGYGETRADAASVWDPPTWARHLASLFTLGAFILLAAAYVPGTRIKAAIGHPMVAGVKLWAIAHLAANGRAGDIVLFGAFLVWAVVDFSSAKRRDRAADRRYAAAAGMGRDLAAVAIGTVAWAAFAFLLHGWLIGVRPFA